GAEALYGYAEAEISGRPVSPLVPPERRHEVAEIAEQIRQGQRLEQFETVHVTRAGGRVDVALTLSPVRDAAGTVIGASVIGRHITARKHAEADLRESQARFALAMRATNDGLWDWDIRTNSVYFSPRWKR